MIGRKEKKENVIDVINIFKYYIEINNTIYLFFFSTNKKYKND